MKLNSAEKIIKIYRQTYWVLAGYFFLSLLLIYIPFNFLQKYEVDAGFLKTLWIIGIILYFINHVLLWFLNQCILTSQRILVISYPNLLHKKVTDLPQDKIVNVAYEKKGLIPLLFDYGNVVIQQQSLTSPLVLNRLAVPSKIKEEIKFAMKN